MNVGVDAELPSEARGLFALPLAGFTTARDSLAKELKKAGRLSEAAAVKGLRKPPVTAWATNQVTHRNPKKVEWLLRSAERLREAGSRSEVQEASSARTELISSFVEEAMEILRAAGHAAGPSAQQRIAQNLLAATADPQLGQVLAAGMLSDDIYPAEPDLGWGLAMPARPQVSAQQKLEAEAEELRRDMEHAEEEALRLRKRADEAEAAAARAETQAHETKKRYEELAARLDTGK